MHWKTNICVGIKKSFAQLVINHVPLILSKLSFVFLQTPRQYCRVSRNESRKVKAKLKYLYLSRSHFTGQKPVDTEFRVISHVNLKVFTFLQVRLVTYLIFELDFQL